MPILLSFRKGDANERWILSKEINFHLDPAPFCPSWTQRSRAAIGQLAVRRTYEKGEMVCLEGEPCPGLIIVETGWISSVKLSPQGREQEIRVAGGGEMINEIQRDGRGYEPDYVEIFNKMKYLGNRSEGILILYWPNTQI